MSSNDLWQQLLQQVESKKEVVEQPQTIQLLGQPETVNSINQLDQYKQQLIQNIQNPPTPQPSVFVGGIEVDEFDDEEIEEEELEEGVDTPSNNSFSLDNILGGQPQVSVLNDTLITPKSQQVNQNAVADIFNLAGISTETEVTPKRGRGRPKGSTANAVIKDLPESISTPQEQDKSITNITQQASQIKQETKEIALAIPKATLLEIGESLYRISAALISVAKS